jgi:hypothetical protein
VATSFANPELAAVYYTERVNLTAADQMLLHNVQLSTIDSWVRLLTAARPSLTPAQARFWCTRRWRWWSIWAGWAASRISLPIPRRVCES